MPRGRVAVIEHRRLDVAGIATDGLRAGSGPPVVLLHGLGDSAPIWEPLVERLAGGYRLYARASRVTATPPCRGRRPPPST